MFVFLLGLLNCGVPWGTIQVADSQSLELLFIALAALALSSLGASKMEDFKLLVSPEAWLIF